jgi:glycosyltransferase involved in cell wall biosynthesis
VSESSRFPTKICFLATGDSIHSFRWAHFFARRGHETHWISLTPFLKTPEEPVHRYEMPNHPWEWVQILRSIGLAKKLLRRIQPDILHLHSAGRHGVLGAMTGFHPCVVTAWGSEVLIAAKSRLMKPLVKWVFRRADLVTCDAEHMRQAMIQLGVDQEKIRIIYFGTDVEKFQPRPAREELRRELGAAESSLVISIRSLEPIYDVETLIRAIPSVLQSVPSAVFVIGGEGSEKEKLVRLAGELGIVPQVRFVGQLPNERLPEYLNAADLYVSTSLSDAGLAASTAEAMACGLPVIVTDSAENKLWVREGEGGFVIPAKNPRILAEKMIALLQNRATGEKWGNFNRRVIQQRNNYYLEMEKMEKLYESLAEQHGKAEKVS